MIALTGYLAMAEPAEDCLDYLDYSKASQCLEINSTNGDCIKYPLQLEGDQTTKMLNMFERAQKCLQDQGGVDCLPSYMLWSEDYQAMVKCTKEGIAGCLEEHKVLLPEGYKACSQDYMPDESDMASVWTADTCVKNA